MMIETTERAHQVLDVAIKFTELMAKAGINYASINHEGRVTAIYLEPEFFKMAFPSVEPTIDSRYTTDKVVSNNYTIHYNGIKFYAFEIKWREGKNDTVQTYNYPE